MRGDEVAINLPISEIWPEWYILTPSYLSKLFKHETGMTITDYLIEVRIKKAKQLLIKSSELKFHEVGCEVGYPDPAYFNKLFKRMVGVTPNEYKKISPSSS